MRIPAIAIVVTAALGLAGCASGSGLFGRNAPDEYAVARQAPLVVPPDFALVPPQPGAPAGVDNSQQQALEALFGGDAPRSATEANIISRAGDGRSDPGIRSNVGDPQTFTVAKGTLTQTIIAAPQGDGQEASAAIPGA